MLQNYSTEQDIPGKLNALIDHLISDLTQKPSPIREGIVMTAGPAPYRRLDCDGRALAYVRARPRKKLIRIDISGLWIAPEKSRLSVPNAGGSISLEVRSEHDRRSAVEYLESIVRKTRAAYGRASDAWINREPCRPAV